MFKVGDRITHKTYPENNGIITSISLQTSVNADIGSKDILYFIDWDSKSPWSGHSRVPCFGEFIKHDTRIRDNRVKKLQEIGI